MPARPAAITGAAFRELAAGQDGVASRQQLRRLGVTRHHVGRRVATGQWRRFGPYVLVLHGGPLSEQQKLWVAVLHGGDGAALGGLTAAIAEGLEGFDCPVRRVLVPHGRNGPTCSTPRCRSACTRAGGSARRTCTRRARRRGPGCLGR